jgi:hypothetical protein
LERHEIVFTFDLPPTQRHWLIAALPSLPQRLLAPSVWLLPADRIDDIELYSVNGHPAEAGLPEFHDAACVRVRPNSNGFTRWEIRDLIPGNLYGLRWRRRSDTVAV